MLGYAELRDQHVLFEKAMRDIKVRKSLFYERKEEEWLK